MSILTLFVPAALACGGCSTPTADAEHAPVSAPASTATATLHVEGMTCASCAVAIKTALGKVEGVVSTTVDVDGKKATVTYDPAKVTPDALSKKVSELGYPSTVQG